ncbi:MAG: hypothetical protein JWM90_843 [Thermoleophilia bacterium]|nr:hypothetical protein [Thermoleophilia bacterium]
MGVRLNMSRLILLAIGGLILALGWSMSAAPGTASAATAEAAVFTACPAIYPRPASCDAKPIVRTAPLSHEGWAYLNLNYCAPGMVCAAMYRMSTPAWSWSGRAWQQTSLNGNSWYYLYPYSGEWRWACDYTRCVAVSGGRFELRPY